MMEDLEAHIDTKPDMRFGIFKATERLRSAGDRYRAVLQEGLRLVEEREAFNKRVAAAATQQRYGRRLHLPHRTRDGALTKYRTTFDRRALAWLAGKAYAYEFGISLTTTRRVRPRSSRKCCAPERWDALTAGLPVIGNGGLADQLATLKANFEVFKGQLGFNAPATQTISFSLRAELARIGLSSRVNASWRVQIWRPIVWRMFGTTATRATAWTTARFSAAIAARLRRKAPRLSLRWSSHSSTPSRPARTGSVKP